jgi:prevent-host-death family protein
MVVNLYEAKTRLSGLVDDAAAGAEIIIAKNGKPMAKLVPLRQRARRKAGRLKGKIWMADDFDAPLPKDIVDAFYSSKIE